MEKWKDIKGFEKMYEVSDIGRIRTHKDKTTYTERHGIRHWKQRIMKFRGFTPKTGYRISLWKDGRFYEFLVARLVAFTFYNKDIYDRSLTVNHIDGDRMNNKIENLELVSLKENIRHGFKNGLYKNCKKTIVKDVKTNEEKIYYSISEASRQLGLKERALHSISDRKGKEFNYKGYYIKIL